MECRQALGIGTTLALAWAALGCAVEPDDLGSVDADPPSDASTVDAERADAAPEPDGGAGADAAAEDSVEAATAPDAQWICLGDNPGRIGGCRNGSEACDDDAFTVTEDRLGPLVLACFAGDQGNGIAFVATNTGPQCDLPSCSGLANDRPRCQGFEKCECEPAWAPGNLQYAADGRGTIRILDCPPEGAVREVDLSAYAGQSLWVGSLTQPDGVGRMTEVCLSRKTW
jgi:hypothetical protein